MPCFAITPNAAFSEAVFCATVGGGMWLETRPIAPSYSSPVAWPFASRSISPSLGSGVLSVMPAMSRPRVFVSAMWPSRLRTKIGRAVSRLSRSCRSGRLPIAMASHWPTVSQVSGS